MDINYFLLCRTKYNSILGDLESIINSIDELVQITEEYVSDEDKKTHIFFSPKLIKDSFISKKEHILYLQDICKKYICKTCHHDFIDDIIDIDPEHSQKIRYCKFCENLEE
jgi:hypothetical protein